MAIYSVICLTANRQVFTTAFKTQIAVFVTTGALKRFTLVEYKLGAADVPNATDCNLEIEVARMTADGTGTAWTTPFIHGLETGTQQVPAATMKMGYTVEPTVTAATQVDSLGWNQRGAYRWVAIDKDAEPEAPAVANNGFVFRGLSPNYASKAASTLWFRE